MVANIGIDGIRNRTGFPFVRLSWAWHLQGITLIYSVYSTCPISTPIPNPMPVVFWGKRKRGTGFGQDLVARTLHINHFYDLLFFTIYFASPRPQRLVLVYRRKNNEFLLIFVRLPGGLSVNYNII